MPCQHLSILINDHTPPTRRERAKKPMMTWWRTETEKRDALSPEQAAFQGRKSEASLAKPWFFCGSNLLRHLHRMAFILRPPSLHAAKLPSDHHCSCGRIAKRAFSTNPQQIHLWTENTATTAVKSVNNKFAKQFCWNVTVTFSRTLYLFLFF